MGPGRRRQKHVSRRGAEGWFVCPPALVLVLVLVLDSPSSFSMPSWKAATGNAGLRTRIIRKSAPHSGAATEEGMSPTEAQRLLLVLKLGHWILALEEVLSFELEEVKSEHR